MAYLLFSFLYAVFKVQSSSLILTTLDSLRCASLITGILQIPSFLFVIAYKRCFQHSFEQKRSLSFCFHGDNEIRTRDPLLARQVLSQLSYTPKIWQPPTLPYRLQ